MPVSATVNSGGHEVVISVSGRFDYSVQKEFRDAYRDHGAECRFRVDLSGAEYLDSAALGMLLLLRKHAGDNNNNVTLEKAPSDVRKMLAIANFDKLFSIS